MSRDFIKLLELEPHPEGGYYRRTYVSEVQCEVEGGERALGSAIYYYLESEDFSAWHRSDVDEILHFYSGGSVTVHSIDLQGQLKHINLGNPAESRRFVPQYLVPKGHWFALEVGCENTHALLGATVFPEFKIDRFELAKRDELIQQFPQHQEIIKRLTRD